MVNVLIQFKKTIQVLMAVALLVLGGSALGQDILIKDLDSDGKMDSISLDRAQATLRVKLSTKHYLAETSQTIDGLTEQSGLRPTRHGFELYINYMRSGYDAQFRYQRKAKAMQLIGMNHYYFGNAVGDGSGKGSVNMLTHRYHGEWHVYHIVKDKLIKMPPINAKMQYPAMLITAFSDAIFDDFSKRIEALSAEQEKKMRS